VPAAYSRRSLTPEALRVSAGGVRAPRRDEDRRVSRPRSGNACGAPSGTGRATLATSRRSRRSSPCWTLQDAAPAVRRLRRWALDLAEVRPGERVVDVGSGTGTVTQLLAGLVGPSGRATGVEPNSAMRAEAVREGGRVARRRPSSRAWPARCPSGTPASTWCGASGCCSTSTTPTARLARSPGCCDRAAGPCCWTPTTTPHHGGPGAQRGGAAQPGLSQHLAPTRGRPGTSRVRWRRPGWCSTTTSAPPPWSCRRRPTGRASCCGWWPPRPYATGW